MATPERLVEATWAHVKEVRSVVGKVVDFGAGDGRFSRFGNYESYVGYEIDDSVSDDAVLPVRARLLNQCAFWEQIHDADVCVGNPPFVRNQDLPRGWRERATTVLRQRTGVSLSGLANAWQYFFLLSLASTKPDGLCAVVIPYEWVSRPSARHLREYVLREGWNVAVYRLVDAAFPSVMTTASITVVDKAHQDGVWSYFEETADGSYTELTSPSGGTSGVLPYAPRGHAEGVPYAKRGLSPGTQKVLTLTEGERVRAGLEPHRDVVPCITTLRHLPADEPDLDDRALRLYYRDAAQKCWLIRTDREPSSALMGYLAGVPASHYHTRTCLERHQWWRFAMPDVPTALVAMSFRHSFPKVARNVAGVRAVGGVYGVYRLSPDQTHLLVKDLGGMDLSRAVVAHSHGLRKIEIGQLNGLLANVFGTD